MTGSRAADAPPKADARYVVRLRDRSSADVARAGSLHLSDALSAEIEPRCL